MGAAPLNWLAKIGGDTLKTKAKLLSSAINELYDNGLELNSNLKDYVKVSTVTVTLNSATQVASNQLVNLKGTFTIPDGYTPLAIVMQFIGKNPAGTSINYYTFGSDGSVDMYVIPGVTETLTSLNLKILFSKI